MSNFKCPHCGEVCHESQRIYAKPKLAELSALQRALPRQPEKKFQAQVVEAAKYMNWWVYHTYDSRKSEHGFPDLVLIRPPDIRFWELKVGRNVPTPAQDMVLGMLDACGMETDVRRPCDWDLIVADLR